MLKADEEKVVFLDRDGVINHDSPHYIKGWDEFEFIPRSIEAIRLLSGNGFKVIVITNQSAVRRGLISPERLDDIHRRMSAAVAASGGRIAEIFFCPHGPDDGCECRKPRPGMLLQAARRHQVRLAEAWMVGDSGRDIACAAAAGCGHTVLVLTGNGERDLRLLRENGPAPTHVANDLYDATTRLIIPLS